LNNNRVSFITFNYDTSFESELERSLSAIEFFEKDDAIKSFMDGRVTHVYGKLGKPGDDEFYSYLFPPNQDVEPWKLRKLWDAILLLSSDIRAIEPVDKDANEALIKQAQEQIRAAECVYILGFGFDKNNCKRIGLPSAFSATPDMPVKRIYFTNFENRNVINKRAGRTMQVRDQIFFPDNFVRVERQYHPDRYIEKSVRDVYQALAMDFDME